MNRINLNLSRFSYSLVLLAVAGVGCKARQDSATTKSITATDADGSSEMMYMPLDRIRTEIASPTVLYHNSLATNSDGSNHPANPINSQPPQNLCLSTCTSATAADEGTENAQDMTCNAVGYVDVQEALAAVGGLSEGARDLFLKALSPSEVLASSSDGSYQELKASLASMMKTDNKDDICTKQRDTSGFSLAELYLSPICFNNRTNATVRVDATVEFKMRGYRNLQEDTGYWTYRPGEKSCLTTDGCEKNEDGLCKMASIRYVASANGRRFQDNGPGIEFRSSRNTTDNLYIDLTGSSSSGTSSGSSSGSSSSSSGSSNNSTEVCANAIEEIYNSYGNSAYQSARMTEVSNCLNATLNTNWDDFRAHFYCQFPGEPVRKCFTYGAAALKQQGYTQEQAYKAMYQACKANGSFNSFSGNMMTNFDAVMNSDSGCSSAAVDKFYRGIGVSRPVR